MCVRTRVSVFEKCKLSEVPGWEGDSLADDVCVSCGQAVVLMVLFGEKAALFPCVPAQRDLQKLFVFVCMCTDACVRASACTHMRSRARAHFRGCILVRALGILLLYFLCVYRKRLLEAARVRVLVHLCAGERGERKGCFDHTIYTKHAHTSARRHDTTYRYTYPLSLFLSVSLSLFVSLTCASTRSTSSKGNK